MSTGWVRWWIAVGVVVATGCGETILPKAPPPLYYQLTYAYVPCSSSLPVVKPLVLKLWPLYGVVPFDDVEMVVEEGRYRVLRSRRHQWIDRPGALLVEWLRKDMERDGVFGKVSNAMERGGEADVELNGVVERWSWEEREGKGRGVLDVTLTIWSKKAPPHVLFNKRYTFVSEWEHSTSPESFADVMSRLTTDLSRSFRDDLYRSMGTW